MEEKLETNKIIKYIKENILLLLGLLFIIIFFISINYNIYSKYTINLLNNTYFKFGIFMISIYIMTNDINISLLLIILLLFIFQKVSFNNINIDFNGD
jgi:hypothetical protein